MKCGDNIEIKNMGKMKNIFIQMKNEQWEGTPAEYLKKLLKEKKNGKNDKITHVVRKNNR